VFFGDHVNFNLIKGVRINFGSELPREVIITLKLIGKKWTMPILYTLNDKNGLGFNELKRELKSKISSNMLSQVLEELTKKNLIEKEVISISPIRVDYSLTVCGQDLCDLCMAVGAFGSKYLSAD
jgi:DNA-binding HxlR family transcriptional regulator